MPGQHQIDLALTLGKQGAPALADDEANLRSVGERCGNEADDAIIVGLGSVRAEPDETAVGLLRRAEASATLAMQRVQPEPQARTPSLNWR